MDRTQNRLEGPSVATLQQAGALRRSGLGNVARKRLATPAFALSRNTKLVPHALGHRPIDTTTYFGLIANVARMRVAIRGFCTESMSCWVSGDSSGSAIG